MGDLPDARSKSHEMAGRAKDAEAHSTSRRLPVGLFATLRATVFARRSTKTFVLVTAVAFALAYALPNTYRKKTPAPYKRPPRPSPPPGGFPAYNSLDEEPEGPPPTFFSVLPSPQLLLDLRQCAAYCGGAKQLDPNLYLGAVPTFDDDLRTAYGGPLAYANQYPQDFPYNLHETNQFALPAIIAARVDHLRSLVPFSERPTLETADYLLLALDTTLLARCIASCSHSELLPPRLDRSQLKRTVVAWIVATVAEHGKRRLYPSLILALGLVDHDYEGSILKRSVEKKIKDDVVVVGIEREPWDSENELRWFTQMPYPSIFSLPLAMTQAQDARGTRETLAIWLMSQERTFLLSFAGKSEPNSLKSGKGPWNGYAVRRHLAKTLANYTDDPAVSVLISNPTTKRGTFIPATHKAMLHSTFCLQPAGDTATRKGYFESILLGCIPVVFRTGTYRRVWSGIDWDRLALVIDETSLLETQGDIVTLLRAVPPVDIARRQRDIAKLAGRIQYGVPREGEDDGWGGDAFGMLLRQLHMMKGIGEEW